MYCAKAVALLEVAVGAKRGTQKVWRGRARIKTLKTEIVWL